MLPENFALLLNNIFIIKLQLSQIYYHLVEIKYEE